MKFRSFYLSAAFIGLLAGVHCIPAFSVPASAENLMLTKEETRALFSDHIYCNYKFSNDFTNEMSFDFYGYGTIGDFDSEINAESYWYNPSGQDCVIYRGSEIPNIPFYDSNNIFELKIFPVIDLAGLTKIQFSSGLSTNGSYSTRSFGYADYNTYFPWFKMFVNNTLTQSRSAFLYSNRSYTPVSVTIDAGSLTRNYYSSIAQFAYSSNNEFTAFCSGDGNSGYIQKYGVSPASNALDSDFGQYYYLFISTVELSSGYINNIPPESSGGGSESSGGGSESSGGYDGPDYTDQLALILAKLDLIINNDFNFDVDLSADLSGVESRLDGITSRLDGTNSRLDGSNSRVDGVNSRLDGVNSRLDGISGELHSLNSSPSGTLPRTGAENSEFDHQAEMYLSDFQNEYSDPENQPFEVAEGSSGFLSFVRQFLLRSHLAGVLPVLALLFIIHYTIFDRRG